ncbi:TIGR03619 family F420-dependent LLM class oxidoreductase [Tomitella biformata]|uniref:TIGR03619 family F420-dependent LLM class oxidoreductase n=1 Tax=Tomitella biformata TaxID=630403 RepID=UPI000466D519|nr:TIGR03619 family F420-dependent LLM class oxidoreductase [Tomitella biformata]
MQIGLNILGAEKLYDGNFSAVLDLATKADRAGIGLISTGDHLGFSRRAHEGRVAFNGFPFDLEYPWLEPMTMLGAVAAVTTRARLGISVLVAPLRPALLLAKQAATLDVISGGRVSLGVGVGWQEDEYAAAGQEFERRFGRLEEMVVACRALWSPEPATFTGRDYAFEDFYSRPLPVQERLPVIFGFAPSASNFDRLARVGDGWTVNPADLPDFPAAVDRLRAAFEAHGRDPGSLEVQVSLGMARTTAGELDLERTAASVARRFDEGATTVMLRPTAYLETADGLDDLLAWMGALV